MPILKLGVSGTVHWCFTRSALAPLYTASQGLFLMFQILLNGWEEELLAFHCLAPIIATHALSILVITQDIYAVRHWVNDLFHSVQEVADLAPLATWWRLLLVLSIISSMV